MRLEARGPGASTRTLTGLDPSRRLATLFELREAPQDEEQSQRTQ